MIVSAIGTTQQYQNGTNSSCKTYEWKRIRCTWPWQAIAISLFKKTHAYLSNIVQKGFLAALEVVS